VPVLVPVPFVVAMVSTDRRSNAKQKLNRNRWGDRYFTSSVVSASQDTYCGRIRTFELLEVQVTQKITTNGIRV
jgi:hypothetical protein